MFLKIEDFLSNVRGFSANSANVKLSKPLIFVFLGNFDSKTADMIIKNYITDSKAVRTLYIFSDCEHSIVEREVQPSPLTLRGRRQLIENIQNNKAQIKQKAEAPLCEMINDFRGMEFRANRCLQIIYVFDAEDIYTCGLKIVSEVIKDVSGPYFDSINEDFFCIVDESVTAGNSGDVKNAFKYLTLQELEEIIPDMGDLGAALCKSGYCISNEIGGVLDSNVGFEEHLKCICKFIAFKYVDITVTDADRNQYIFKESSFKEECGNRNRKGKFFTIGCFSLEKDNAFIQATVMDWIIKKIAGESNGEFNIAENVRMLRPLNVDQDIEGYIRDVIKIVDGEVTPSLLYGLYKANINTVDIPDKNGEAVEKLFGESINEFVDTNVIAMLNEKAVNDLVSKFKRELEDKINSFVKDPERSINDIVKFLKDQQYGLVSNCNREIRKSVVDLSDEIRKFDEWKNQSCDIGNVEVKSIGGESAAVFSIADRYMRKYLAKRKPEIRQKIFEEYRKIVNKIADKYESVNKTIKDLANRIESCVGSSTEALRTNDRDITKRGVKDFYTKVMDAAETQDDLQVVFDEFFRDMNKLICSNELSEEDFDKKFGERFNGFMDVLYKKIPVFNASFSEECKMRLEGDVGVNINRMAESEILSHEDGLYSMSIYGNSSEEYWAIGLIAGLDDSIVDYLLREGLSSCKKYAYFDANKRDDFDVIYIKGAFRAENIKNCQRIWKRKYDELVKNEAKGEIPYA